MTKKKSSAPYRGDALGSGMSWTRVKEKQPTRAKHIQVLKDGWKTVPGDGLSKR